MRSRIAANNSRGTATSSGLNLYIMASNFFGLFEQQRIRKHIREEEERQKTGQSTSEVRPPDQGPAKALRKPKFLQWLEKLAEEARRK